MGGSAIMGGASSYMTDGSFAQGAAVGAFTGGMMGRHLGRQTMSNAGRYLGRGANMQGPRASKFSSGMVTAGNFLESKEMRRVMIGSGAMLGGAMFGGNRSHRKGFNANRGNTIGR